MFIVHVIFDSPPLQCKLNVGQRHRDDNDPSRPRGLKIFADGTDRESQKEMEERLRHEYPDLWSKVETLSEENQRLIRGPRDRVGVTADQFRNFFADVNKPCVCETVDKFLKNEMTIWVRATRSKARQFFLSNT